MTTNIVFMGTPDFAVPALKALLNASDAKNWQVVGVVTQPDRPKGRGKKLSPPPVKVIAEAAGVFVLQPKRLKTPEAFAKLAALKPDLIVVAAFGQILRKNVLDLPQYGCLNIHASLLPRWRGASPVTAAIQAGDVETGVTIMKIDESLDSGPILTQQSKLIKPHDTGGTLTTKLAELGATLLIETLPAWLSGQIEPVTQDETLVTMTRLLKKSDGKVDWNLPAATIARQIRAFSPWPGTFTHGPRGQIKVLAADLAAETVSKSAVPGTIFKHHKFIYIMTGQGALQLITVQPAGKKAMSAQAMLNGQPELLETQLS